jgi:hypothetical protein
MYSTHTFQSGNSLRVHPDLELPATIPQLFGHAATKAPSTNTNKNNNKHAHAGQLNSFTDLNALLVLHDRGILAHVLLGQRH